MIALDGLPALSPFRIDRLNAELARLEPGAAVLATRHVYLVDAPDPAALDLARLGEVVQASSAAVRSASLFVVPRLGTRSPWSSKATDILVDCGFPVRRIERGLAFDLDGAPPPGSADWSRMLRALHDPMTQSVIVTLAEADVFRSGDALPLARIALGDDARPA
ncbi:MAG TPA: phosphoribosylformylglycinamidine synthase, partial [Dokdonella sp.]